MADTPGDKPTTGPIGIVGGKPHDAARRRTKHDLPTPEERAEMRQRWGLDGFDEIDKAMLRILLERPAIKDRELGIAVGLSREQTNRRKNRPAFRLALEESQLDALAVFQKNQTRAARRLADLIDSPDHQVAVRACLAHLAPILRDNRAGESGAEAFAKLLEEAYTLRENRKTSTASTGTTPPQSTAATA